MLTLPPSVKIYVSSQPVDARKSFDGLAALVAYSDVIRSAFRRHSISVPKASDQDSGAFDQRFRSFDHPFRPSDQGRPSG